MNLSTKILILFLLMVASGKFCYGQQVIKILNADNVSGERRGGVQFTKFSGNVIFQRGDTKIYCDEALKKGEYMEAKGHVHITEGDSIDITGESLLYDGTTRIAKLRKNVVFAKKGVMTLYTNNLDYDREKQMAYYFNNGRLVDSTNTLRSRKGYYQVDRDLASFKGKVNGKNDDFTLNTDTLQYNTISKVIYFFAKTIIKDKDNNIVEYQEGSYDTQSGVSRLEKNTIHSDSYIISSDYLNVLDKEEIYKADVNVKLVDEENDIIVTGESAIHWKKTGITKVFNNPVLEVILDSDTIYMTADTLLAVDSRIASERRLFAYRNVKLFKNDLRGKADSLVYNVPDSLINFYFNPVLWVEGNQISADSITGYITNKKLSRMEMVSNSFVVSEDTLGNYNQIKGRDIVAYFKDNKLSKVDVTGNGESIFYALNEEETEIEGMNKSQSSTITIIFSNNKAKSVKFYSNVDSSLIPPHELKPSDQTLKGFSWLIKDRPSKEDVLHLKTTEDKSGEPETQN